MSIREKRQKSIRERRKSEILDSAIRVFIKKGFRNTSMEDIIRETSLSKGGFYYYFKSTKEILLMMMEEAIIFQLEDMEEKLRGFESQRIEEYAQFIVDYLLDSAFAKGDEKTLTAMLYAEIIYDPEYLEFFNRNQMKGILGIIDILRRHFPEIPANDAIVPRFVFLGQYLNGLLLTMETFKSRESFEAHKSYIKSVFLDVIGDTFGLDSLLTDRS